MATFTLNAHSVILDNEALRKVTLWSQQDRSASTSSYYVIRVGIGRGADTDWIGEYDGSAEVLVARSQRDLTGSVEVDRLLVAGEALVIEVTKTGTPSVALAGLTVEFQMNLVGGESTRPGALFALSGHVPDARARAATEGLVSQLNRSGVQSWTVCVPLIDPDSAPTFDVENSYTTTDKTITAGGSFEASDVSITFTKPADKTTGYVHVNAAAAIIGVTGTGTGSHAIGDGTTDHNAMSFTTETARGNVRSVGYAGEITASTTFTYRVKCATNNMTLQESAIWGSVVWT